MCSIKTPLCFESLPARALVASSHLGGMERGRKRRESKGRRGGRIGDDDDEKVKEIKRKSV